jgi:hypothetical protein
MLFYVYKHKYYQVSWLLEEMLNSMLIFSLSVILLLFYRFGIMLISTSSRPLVITVKNAANSPTATKGTDERP